MPSYQESGYQLSFDLVVDPHELSYWGISPSTEFACIVIWVILWLWAIRSAIFLSVWVFESGPHPYRSVIHPVSFSSLRVGAAPISIGHLVISLSFRVRTAPISISHSSCQFQFGSSRGRTYIDRPSCYQFVFLSQNRTYIDRSFVVSVWVEVTPILIGHLPVLSVFESGPHLYRSVIHPVSFSSVRVWTAPISIGHSSC